MGLSSWRSKIPATMYILLCDNMTVLGLRCNCVVQLCQLSCSSLKHHDAGAAKAEKSCNISSLPVHQTPREAHHSGYSHTGRAAAEGQLFVVLRSFEACDVANRKFRGRLTRVGLTYHNRRDRDKQMGKGTRSHPRESRSQASIWLQDIYRHEEEP